MKARDNFARAEMGGQVLNLSRSLSGDTGHFADDLTDCLANLMHFATLTGLDFERARAIAEMHHEAELEEEAS